MSVFNLKEKKAVSPVITTILLVLIVIVLAAIILLWGLTFIPEALSKLGNPIEDKCSEVSFTASYASGKLQVTNNGNIPIYEIGVNEKDAAISEVSTIEIRLNPGGSKEVSYTSSGQDLEIRPIILGETDDNEIQKFTCKNKEVWETVTV
jgi:flagellin-like protein